MADHAQSCYNKLYAFLTLYFLQCTNELRIDQQRTVEVRNSNHRNSGLGK